MARDVEDVFQRITDSDEILKKKKKKRNQMIRRYKLKSTDIRVLHRDCTIVINDSNYLTGLLLNKT